VDFEKNACTKGADGTPYYVTKDEAKHLSSGETLLDTRITRKSDGA
jgi:hypothetical protein